MRAAATECNRPGDPPPPAERDALPKGLKTGTYRRATLLSSFYDIYVMGRALFGPPIRQHAASGNRLQPSIREFRHVPPDCFEAGMIQSGASWLALLTTGATS